MKQTTPSPVPERRRSNRRPRPCGTGSIWLPVAFLVFASPAGAQAGASLRGQVTEAEFGRPLASVVVTVHTVDDARVGIVRTSEDGAFHFEDLEAAVYRLRFRHPAFRPATTDVRATTGDSRLVTVRLEPSAVPLDSLRVESSLRALGVRIDPDAVPASATIGLTSVIAGQAAGVSVTRTSGQAGAAGRIRIRGARSLQAGTPLIFVDGVRVGSANITAPTGTEQVLDSLDGIATSDVEMIEVLRGPDAVMRYGSGARDGVILITTRRTGRIRR